MKKVLVLLLIVFVSSGCATKLEQARTNITRTWQVSKVFQNGQETTTEYLQSFGEYRITFDNNGGFVETYYPFSGQTLLTVTGEWVFSDGINKVTLSDPNQSRVYEIDRLDEDHFNVTDLGSNDNTEIQLIPG